MEFKKYVCIIFFFQKQRKRKKWLFIYQQLIRFLFDDLEKPFEKYSKNHQNLSKIFGGQTLQKVKCRSCLQSSFKMVYFIFYFHF